MKEKLIIALKEITDKLGVPVFAQNLDYPENPDHGDFSTNVAMMNAKRMGQSPKVLAERIVAEFKVNMPEFLQDVSVAGPGFINFFVKDRFFAEEVLSVLEKDGVAGEKNKDIYGKSNEEKGKKVMVEYTDPNPFKVIHIGHLMSNAIGEAVSRLIDFSGAEVVRANWQGDVGPHVAKAIWGAMHNERKADEEPAAYWGRAYVIGSEAADDPEKKKEIDIINRQVYERSEQKVNELYDLGRQECLDAFEIVYKRLGTKFNNYFFEGKEGRNGEMIAKELLKEGVLEMSDGAIVFKGEKFGLHTRVFITSQGLPTYEAKELGLNKEKFKIYPDLSESIILTGNEQSDYFKVLLKVMTLVYPEIAAKTKHIPHGMLRFASGKMSSRKGNVISAEALIDEIKELVKAKIVDRGFSGVEADEISDIVAIGAIKYTILRQSIGGDVVFDSAASISFEGDSGPYLQYSAVRAQSILAKAKDEGMEILNLKSQISKIVAPEKVTILEKLIARFPDMIMRARKDYAPQIIANYLINLAGAFNSFYASQIIVDKNDKYSPYYVAITKAFMMTMTNGLWILGIKVPKRM